MFNFFFFVSVFLGFASFVYSPDGGTFTEKTISNFNVRFFVTTDRKVLNRWDGPEASYEKSSTKIVRKGQRFYPLISFKNAVKSNSGKVHIKYKILVTRPDGKILVEDEMLAWRGLPRHDGRELSREFLDLAIGPKDPQGKYKISVLVIDVIANTQLQLKMNIDCIP